MTKNEALQALKLGKKVTGPWFTPEEFIRIENGVLVDEKGYKMHDFWRTRTESVWDNGWSVYKNEVYLSDLKEGDRFTFPKQIADDSYCKFTGFEAEPFGLYFYDSYSDGDDDSAAACDQTENSVVILV